MTDLLLVHGRSQQDKDAATLRATWVGALREGLAASGLRLPVPDDAIRFPYYGDTLRDLVADRATVADVIVRGEPTDAAETAFLKAVLVETLAATGVSAVQVDAEREPADVMERDALDGPWIAAALRALDRHVPGASATSIATITRDVHLYLRSIGIRDQIEGGVRSALRPGVPTVVVAHSLGSVVAYNLLRRDGERDGWAVPLFVTLGSPIAVRAVRGALRPNRNPSCVARWLNARDPRDVIALHPLDTAHFPVDPPVHDRSDVDNTTPNRHGIVGYLADPGVARSIHDALVAG